MGTLQTEVLFLTIYTAFSRVYVYFSNLCVSKPILYITMCMFIHPSVLSLLYHVVYH